jgi:DNA-binding phage protein
MRSAFWEDHEADLADPEYARAFAAESVRLATIDDVMGTIADQAAAVGMSKAALARSIGADPSAVRRLLSAPDVNPTLGTLAEIAAALGLRVTLSPMSDDERRTITEPMTAAERRPTSHRSAAP